MATESKTQKARKLFQLTYSSLNDFPPVRSNASEGFKKHAESIREKVRALRIELIEKHYTESQLDALIGFYETDIGASILDVRERLALDLKDQMPKILNSAESDSNGNLGVIIRTQDPDDDDT
ncbi:MAG: DUF2059 domain-containing protein [Pseudomonadales bacterium]|nr:DUF2059 domain-containing protein [Pseudomonadales bacterium]